jgi:hypothetical protein
VFVCELGPVCICHLLKRHDVPLVIPQVCRLVLQSAFDEAADTAEFDDCVVLPVLGLCAHTAHEDVGECELRVQTQVLHSLTWMLRTHASFGGEQFAVVVCCVWRKHVLCVKSDIMV